MKREPCLACGAPKAAGQPCPACSHKPGSHNDAEYRRNRATIRANATLCELCGKAFEPGDRITVDHKLAIANGGDHSLANLRAAHETCNKRRGDR